MIKPVLLSRALFVNYSVKRGLATFRTINSNHAISSGRKGACPHPRKNTFLMRGLVNGVLLLLLTMEESLPVPHASAWVFCK